MALPARFMVSIWPWNLAELQVAAPGFHPEKIRLDAEQVEKEETVVALERSLGARDDQTLVFEVQPRKRTER